MEEMPNEPGSKGNEKEKRQLTPFFFPIVFGDGCFHVVCIGE